MAALTPEGSQFDARQYDAKMSELLGTDGQEFFTSYDEVFESFDAMGLQENLLRGIYAYGMSDHAFCFWKKFKLSELVYLVEAVNATHRHVFPCRKKNVMILDFL